MERRDWVLLAARYSNDLGLSPVVLQKSLFLLGAELREEIGDDFYQFEPHNYGPFSKQIYRDAERLAEAGLLAIERNPESYPLYRITAAGRDRVAEIEAEISPRVRDYLANAVEWAQRQSFPQLIRAIYDKYPDYRINSVFQY